METNTDALCAAWLEAKRAETKANAERIEIEKQLSEAFDVPTEGSKTHQTPSYKVTMTQPIARKVDEAAWEKVKGKVDAALWPIRTKIEADGLGCRFLAENEPIVWRKIAAAFEAKPGKIGVKVEAK